LEVLMQRNQLLAASLAVLGLTIAGPVITSASAQIYSGNYNQRTALEGDRFETMRSLAHFLDEGTQFTFEEATNALANSRNRNERAFLDSLRRLADRTASFHDRLDSYQANPWDVESDVRSLLTETRRVNSRLRRINAMSDLSDDWAAVVDDANRMRRLLAGEDIQVPPAHAEWDNRDMGNDHHPAPYDNGYGGVRQVGNYGNDRTAWITGRNLQEARRLSHDLDTQARRALATAERNTDASGRGAQLLSDLRHFVNQTSALHDRTDSDRIDPRDFGPVVAHLMEDARAADSSMRQARVFSDAWDEWQRTINTLEQLDAIVRR
jgi:hypothetical protein